MSAFQCGYVAIIGQPNVGKSTLLNAFVGQKLAGVSPKPQMTRHRILGIKTLPQAQILFLDTPGIHKPHRSLNEYMMEVAHMVLADADVFVFMIEPDPKNLGRIRGQDQDIFETLRKTGRPVIVVINKSDKIAKDHLLPLMEACEKAWSPKAIIPTTATQKNGLDRVEAEILKYLPTNPAFYPDDQASDQNDRFLVSEVIREKIMALTLEEVPYSVTIDIEEFREPREEDAKKLIRVRAAIICEKDSQKAILIGKGGQMIKKIGAESRLELEKELGEKVYLELFVRVEKDWTQNPQRLREFGYVVD